MVVSLHARVSNHENGPRYSFLTTGLSRGTLGWGWGSTGARRPVSDGCGDMEMNLYEAVESGDVAKVRRLDVGSSEPVRRSDG